MNKTNKLQFSNELEKAYLAGFLDGDGCINAQLIRRKGYRLKFQIRVSITFYQSTKRHWFLLELQNFFFHCGSLRKRKDGLSEYSIVGMSNVLIICKELLPYLLAHQSLSSFIGYRNY